MKKAVIVAAGLSSRLYPLTENKPKCLLEIGGQTILSRNIALLKSVGIEEIYIVTGYLNNMIEAHIDEVCSYIYNPYFKHCNNMGSLHFAKPYVNNEPFIYMHGDIIFTEGLLKNFLEKSKIQKASISLAVDFKDTDQEAMKVRVTEEKALIESNKEIPLNESAGEWIGLSVINNPTVVFEQIQEILQEEKLNVYDTYAFNKMVEDGYLIKCLPTKGENWMEIDFIEDYEKAKRMFE